MKYDVVALGELLIDFTGYGTSEQGNSVFEANPGGAPCNVLAMLSKLGKKTAFIGKVGNDMFGNLLQATIESKGIDASNLIKDESVNTTLAFVHTAPDGNRDFSFFRNPGADTQLTAKEINTDIIKNSQIFHFGSLSLTNEPARQATQYAVRTAKENGVLVSFDPNLREPLWNDMQIAKEQIIWGISQCDILKIADEELEFVKGSRDILKTAQELLEENPNIKILFVTKGENGAEVFYQDIRVHHDAFTNLNIIETTGAGDTFCGCALANILELGFDNLTKENITKLMRFSNAAASLISTRKGAINSMPEREEILAII